jgi:hypothetical protein
LPLTGKARSVQRTLEPLDDRLTSRSEETTMTTDEAARLRLYQRAREVLGDDTADTLMDSLPPDRDQLATRTDVSALRGDLGALETNLRGEMATLAANLRGEMATLGSDLRVDIRDATNGLLRTLFFGMVGTNATLVGLVFAAVRLA